MDGVARCPLPSLLQRDLAQVNLSPSLQFRSLTQSEGERATKLTFEEKQSQYHTRASVEALRHLKAIQDAPTTALIQQADKIAKLDGAALKSITTGTTGRAQAGGRHQSRAST